MPYRRIKLVKDEIYHVYNRSISDFIIFNNEDDYERMRDELLYYSIGKPACNFPFFRKLRKNSAVPAIQINHPFNRTVDILAYCIMPTHIHFLLKENSDGCISKFMESVMKSYSRYFNLRHNRKGPLWESRFNNVLIESNEQFVHLTRYIHLNPVTAYIVDKPQDWIYSSYREYIGLAKDDEKICSFSDYLTMDINSYKNFVDDQIDYQRDLASAKTIH